MDEQGFLGGPGRARFRGAPRIPLPLWNRAAGDNNGWPRRPGCLSRWRERGWVGSSSPAAARRRMHSRCRGKWRRPSRKMPCAGPLAVAGANFGL